MRRTRRRKSSAGSKETVEAAEAIRTPSFGTSSITPVHTDVADDHGVIDYAEDGDDDEKANRSRKNSILGHPHAKREKKKDRKRREKRERKQAKRNGDDTINEGVASSSNEKQPEDLDAPRRVDFAMAEDTGALTDSSQKRPFTLRGISVAGIRPILGQNVFMQSPPETPGPIAPAGPIPRVKYGIRRTNSLPDRLNQTTSALARNPSNVQPVGIETVAIAEGMPSNDIEDENISRTTAVLLLLISTGLVALCAEFMVDSINAVVGGDNPPLSEAFVGLIILPIVGNAAEHVTAVTVVSSCSV